MAERHIGGKGSSESCMAIPVVEAYEADHAPTTSCWNYNSNIPCMAEQSQATEGHDSNQFLHYVYVRYPSTKKRGFRLKKLYSTRARGRSSPLRSLARKICRFKVRTILIGDTTATTNPNKRNDIH